MKQEVLRMEVVEDELEKVRKEVAALKELGELKDKEVKLLRRRLEESEARFEEGIEEREI